MKLNVITGLPDWQIPKIDLKLKLTTILIIVSLFKIQANGYGQGAKITLDIKDASIVEIFNEIESFSEIRFLYGSDVIDLSRKLTLDVKGKNIEEVLGRIFSDRKIDHKIFGRQVILYQNEQEKSKLDNVNVPPSGFETIVLQNQVAGTITDEQGVPLPGVNILEKGTTNGTQADFDGQYSINVNEGDVLVFSYIGMKTQEHTVTGTSLSVVMESEAVTLGEVIAIGYGSVLKKELTGAVVQVKGEDLSNVITSDLGTALQGQVAGVNVIASSGAPGAQSEILIRGVSSISGSNEPLFVVDGVPFDGDPGLNPNEIETIDILKDAASAAIYGTRGASGVILITTKQGKVGSMQVSANASYSIQDIRSGTPLMNATEQTYFEIVKERNFSGAQDDNIFLNLARDPVGFLYDTDLGKQVYINNAAAQDYSVNVSGGTKDVTYNMMVGYYNKEGVVVNSDFERVNSRINIRYTQGKFQINGNLGIKQETTDRSPSGIIVQAIKYYPTQPSLDLDYDGPLRSMAGDEGNRLGWVLESFKNTDNAYDTNAFGSINPVYELLEGLELSGRFSLNYTNGYRKRFSPYQEIYNIYGDLVSNPTTSNVRMDSSREMKTDVELAFKYNKKIGDHDLTFQAVYTLEDYINESFFGTGEGVLDNEIRVLGGTSVNPEIGSGFDWRTKQIGYLGRILYSYKSRYMLNSSTRSDGSSMFGENYRWGMFPSISAAWNVSSEPFWSSMKETVNNLKLRVGRGTVGNNRFTPYTYAAGITGGKDYAFGSDASSELSLGATQEQFANADVKWETSIQWNAGLDIGMFKNKLNFTAEIYDTKKEDMLFPVVLPGSASGRSETLTLNIGDMTNKGVELSLGYRTQVGQMKLGFGGNFSLNDNKITKMVTDGEFIMTNDNGITLGYPAYGKVTAMAEGYEAGAFFIYTTNGIIDTNEKLVDYQELNPNARMGDLIFEDNDGDGTLTERDRVYAGSGLPEYEAGFNMNAEYKNFDFSMQWYSAIGHEIMNGAKATAYGFGRHKDLMFQWSEANPETTIPAFRGFANVHDNYRGYTDQWLEDGTYLRLKAITLGYSLPQNVLEKIALTKVRIYLNAQNPLTFTNYEGYDPEVGGGIASRGLDKGNYPITSLYVVGLNLNF